ncbi:MAG: hypothetical protein QM655_00980 [Nocardioidaceae bacterium]
MSEARDELISLIEQLPDEKAETLLRTARVLQGTPSGGDRPWPPAFFGSIKHAKSGKVGIARNLDDYLAESGFGADFRG